MWWGVQDKHCGDGGRRSSEVRSSTGSPTRPPSGTSFPQIHSRMFELVGNLETSKYLSLQVRHRVPFTESDAALQSMARSRPCSVLWIIALSSTCNRAAYS